MYVYMYGYYIICNACVLYSMQCMCTYICICMHACMYVCKRMNVCITVYVIMVCHFATSMFPLYISIYVMFAIFVLSLISKWATWLLQLLPFYFQLWWYANEEWGCLWWWWWWCWRCRCSSLFFFLLLLFLSCNHRPPIPPCAHWSCSQINLFFTAKLSGGGAR